MPASIKFDNTEILSTTYNPQFVKHESIPERNIVSMPLAREDGNVFITEFFGEKRIVVQGILMAATESALDTAIDTFKELFRRVQKNLDISWEAGTRRYVATCIKHNFDRDHFNLLFVPWSAEFIIPSGEGKDTSVSTPNNEVVLTTTTPVASTVVLAGSKPPKPTIKIQGSNFPATAQGIEFKNTDTGEKIIMTRSSAFGNTDIVRFYCDEKKVTYYVSSEVEQDFYGVFPNFDIGTNNVQISVGSLVNQETTQLAASFGTGSLINATTRRLAQSFEVPYANTTFKGIQAVLDKTGSPGDITWRVETDNGNKPSGTLVGANATGTIAAASVGASAAYVVGNSTNTWSLSANTKYWLVLSAAATLDVSNNYGWSYGASLYTKGNASESSDSGSTYTDAPTNDFGFKILYGGTSGTSSAKFTVTYYKTYL